MAARAARPFLPLSTPLSAPRTQSTSHIRGNTSGPCPETISTTLRQICWSQIIIICGVCAGWALPGGLASPVVSSQSLMLCTQRLSCRYAPAQAKHWCDSLPLFPTPPSLHSLTVHCAVWLCWSAGAATAAAQPGRSLHHHPSWPPAQGITSSCDDSRCQPLRAIELSHTIRVLLLDVSGPSAVLTGVCCSGWLLCVRPLGWLWPACCRCTPERAVCPAARLLQMEACRCGPVCDASHQLLSPALRPASRRPSCPANAS